MQTKSLLLILSTLFGLVHQCFAQIPNQRASEKVSIQSKDIHLVLRPNEARDPIKIDESCLILIRDMPMEITFPFGKSFRTVLPAGTRYLVPAGTYEVKNINDFVIEYRLTPATECRLEK